MSPVKVYHFNNGTGGGVLSYIRNLFIYGSGAVENHMVYLLNKKDAEELTSPELIASNQPMKCYYSASWNFYHTCKKVSEVIPDREAIIVAHDWLELGMASHLGLENKVAFVLHGDYDYYYNLAIKHEQTIDLFIAVSGAIKQKLLEKIPHRETDITYCRAALPDGVTKVKEPNSVDKVVFIGRCTPEKGFPLLPEIALELQKRGVQVSWHIVGEGSDKLSIRSGWEPINEVTFYGWRPNAEVLQLLAGASFVVLPSLAEGMPLGIAEAMKCGVIPIVNDISGGLSELIEQGVNGYKIANNNPMEYANRIQELVGNPTEKEKMSENAIDRARRLFDAKTNTAQFENELIRLADNTKRLKKKARVYGSRLDQSWLPNYLTAGIRNSVKFLKGGL